MRSEHVQSGLCIIVITAVIFQVHLMNTNNYICDDDHDVGLGVRVFIRANCAHSSDYVLDSIRQIEAAGFKVSC